LPFCSLSLKSKKPISKQYPAGINTLGDHLRRKRLDVGLLQREVAERIGVDATTIYHWEKQGTQPEIRFIALIIEFLGYNPFRQPKSFTERIKTYRLKLGLSQRKMAEELGIDPSTLGGWESGQQKPTKNLLNLIDSIVN
jgi:transcriptional regulator with XRE-family HTH domain